ncbi:hypothetical protein P3342_012543 [Pyrenophora teres f. teres]|nr:hypothetical protein P3342_012543 [Pyrenophora teres f. teres]
MLRRRLPTPLLRKGRVGCRLDYQAAGLGGDGLLQLHQTPYLTACTLLEKARVLGNQSSQYHAAQFLQAWRERGSPFRGGGELAGSQSKMHTGARCLQLLSVRDDADREFCFA